MYALKYLSKGANSVENSEIPVTDHLCKIKIKKQFKVKILL